MSNTSRSIGSTDHLSSSPERNGRSYIFAIGINEYQHFQTLEYAASDVENLVRVLIGRYQFNNADVKLMLNKEATRSNIHKHFRHLAQTVKETDSLVVLFSGHGTYDKILDKGYWIPVDARPEDTGSYIANIEITGFLESIRSRHTLVISDSCFSGKLFGRSKFIPRAELLESTPSRWMMTSGRAELVPDKSKFAESLAAYLEKNKQPELRFNDVFHSIYSAVVNNSWQTPRYEPLQNVGHEGGEFILRFKGYQEPEETERQVKYPEPEPVSPAPPGPKPPKSIMEKPGVQIGIAAAGIAITALLLAMLFPGWFGLKKPGVSQAKPEVVAPAFIDVGTVGAGKDTTFEFMVQNKGAATAHLWPIACSCTDIQVLNNLSDSIGGNQSKSYKATWKAGSMEGSRQCTLTFSGANLAQQVKMVARMEVTKTAEVAEQPKPEPPPAGTAAAQIVALKSSIDLGDVGMGKSKEFKFTLRNKGNAASGQLRMVMTYDDGTTSTKILSGIPAGKSETYTASFSAGNETGARKATLTIKGYPVTMDITATVNSEGPVELPKGTFTIQVNAGGVKGVRVWVADDLTGETYDIITTEQATMAFKIPQRMNGKTVVVNFELKGKTHYSNWKLSPGAVIDVPERLKSN